MLGTEAVSAKNESDLALTLVNGAQLWYRSGDRPDLLYGFDSHGLVIDEASRVSEEAWHAAFSTMSATTAARDSLDENPQVLGSGWVPGQDGWRT